MLFLDTQKSANLGEISHESVKAAVIIKRSEYNIKLYYTKRGPTEIIYRFSKN